MPLYSICEQKTLLQLKDITDAFLDLLKCVLLMSLGLQCTECLRLAIPNDTVHQKRILMQKDFVVIEFVILFRHGEVG